MFNGEGDADIIGFGFRTNKGKGYFSLGISAHTAANYALPSDLFKITENGFPNKTSLDFSPMRMQFVAYRQISIGYSRKITDRLTAGVNVKPLFGAMAVATKIDKLDLYTGADRWELNAKGNVYASYPIDVKTDAEGKLEGGLKGIEARDLEDEDFMDYGTGFHNPGIAIDLGAEYQINDRLAVSAALNNLGFISWNRDLNSMSFDGKYTFNGIYYDASSDGSIEDLFKALGDSVAKHVGYTMHHDKFRTALPPVLHLGGTYQLTKAISAGLLSRSVFWRKGVRQSFHGSLSLQPYSFIALNAGATWQVKGGIGVGGGMTFLFGPLQFYFLVDGIPARYSNISIASKDDNGNSKEPTKASYIPTHMKSVTARFGFNLVFGRHGYVNKPMLDKGKSSWN
jgi:hypothetical protein